MVITFIETGYQELHEKELTATDVPLFKYKQKFISEQFYFKMLLVEHSNFI